MKALAALDLLGAWKWPTLLAITVLPLASYWLSWRDWDAGLGSVVYGPELLAGVPFVLLHPADVDPRADALRWALRTCDDCVASLPQVRLGYAGCAQPPERWVEAHGRAGRLAATLPADAMAACVWLELKPAGGAAAQRRWPLAATTP